MSMRHFIDKMLTKGISKKLFVWVTSTTLLCFGLITPDIWASISLGYVGIQGFVDMTTAWKKAGPVSKGGEE